MIHDENQFNVESNAPLMGASGGQSSRAFNSKMAYGFGSLNSSNNAARGSLIRMQATPDDKDVEVTADITQEDAADKEVDLCKEPPKFKPVYAYFVLFIVLMCRIMVQWHRKGLTYAYGYTGLGAAANNPIYEISTEFP